MSVQLLCPACGAVTEVHRAPVRECSRCHAELPDALQRSINSALAASAAPKPLLLAIGQWLSLFAGVVFLATLLSSPFDAGSYWIDGESVSGPEFLRRAGWVFAALGGVLVAIGVGLWRNRAWARPLMLVYWLVIPLLVLSDARATSEDVAAAVVATALVGGIAAWYLYRKPNVRAYFDSRAVAPGSTP